MNSSELTPRKPLRLWPGVAAVVLQWLFWYVVPVAVRDSGMAGMIGAAVCALVILVWWLFFSRARWSERVGAIVLMIAAVFATKRLVDPSIAGGGMGMLLYIAVIPGLCLALVAWAVATRRFSDGARRASLVAAILLACAPWTLLRTAGIIGSGSELHWRWTPTPEERLLAQERLTPLDSARSGPATPTPPPAAVEAPTEVPAPKTRDESAALPATPSTVRAEPAAPA